MKTAEEVFDKDLAPICGPLFELMALRGKAPVHDIASRRAAITMMYAGTKTSLPPQPGVSRKDVTITTADGYAMPAYWYSPASAVPGPAMVYIHGGGYIAGTVSDLEAVIRTLVGTSNIPALAVEYRLAPEFPFPTPVEDCLAGVTWLQAHAAEYGVDPARIAVFGASAGGGLVAATALLAREKRLAPPIRQQLMMYPMLDDRNLAAADPELAPWLLWNEVDNLTGWAAYLGKGVEPGGDGVSQIAAPARMQDLKGLPDAYIDVGTLDWFIDEDIEYARRLVKAGVHTELHVYPGCPHAWEDIAPDAPVSKRAVENRLAFLARL